MTPFAAHSGGLGQLTLSPVWPTQLISAARIRPAQLILILGRVRPAQLIVTLSPVWPTQLISAARIRPAQLILILGPVGPAELITWVLSWL